MSGFVQILDTDYPTISTAIELGVIELPKRQKQARPSANELQSPRLVRVDK